MLNKFWAQKFSEVKDDANEFLKPTPNDGAVLFLLERAELCLKQPPDSHWDGVNRMAVNPSAPEGRRAMSWANIVLPR